MYYVFHGDEEFRCSQAVAKLKAQIMSDGIGDLNIVVLDGKKVGLGELIGACNTVPFLTDRRLVIVEGLLGRLEPRVSSRAKKREKSRSPSASELEYADKLAAYLPDLPPSTRLVFVERKRLSSHNPILKQATDSSEAYVREFKQPGSGALQDWIRRQARRKGADITGDAVRMLISFVGQNMRLLDQELEKLVALVNYSGTITGDDVKALVHATHDPNIFSLVDALGLRDRQRAMLELQELLATGASDLYLLAMMARQIRLILSVKDLVEEKGLAPDATRRELRISHRFILEKLLRQARWFSIEELEMIQRRMLGIDQAIKTGSIEGSLALELLVVEVCRRESDAPKRGYQGRRRERTLSASSSSSLSPEQRSRYS
jgi:DNA polymerase-3 subunit delta